MGNFLLRGKVRDSKNETVRDLKVFAFDYDPLFNPNDFLGETAIDPFGLFEIRFDESRFQSFWEFLEGTPDVYIILKDDEGKQILKSENKKTRREIEYQIKLVDHTPNPSSKDIYADNYRRILSMLGDVGSIIGQENTINLNLLRNPNLPGELRDNLQNFVNDFEVRQSNFNQFNALLSGIVNESLEEENLGTIGYDGPQVPRFPRRETYNQIVVWPRAEKFKWE